MISQLVWGETVNSAGLIPVITAGVAVLYQMNPVNVAFSAAFNGLKL